MDTITTIAETDVHGERLVIVLWEWRSILDLR
jgi:hypothetical protein